MAWRSRVFDRLIGSLVSNPFCNARNRFAGDYNDAWKTGGEAAVKGVKEAYGALAGTAGGGAAPAVENTVKGIEAGANIVTEVLEEACGAP